MSDPFRHPAFDADAGLSAPDPLDYAEDASA